MRYFQATLACASLVFAYGLLCLALGAKHGGGAIPLLLITCAAAWLWRHFSKR